jgi:hypothetical protein
MEFVAGLVTRSKTKLLSKRDWEPQHKKQLTPERNVFLSISHKYTSDFSEMNKLATPYRTVKERFEKAPSVP